jgi:hypothetical protein
MGPDTGMALSDLLNQDTHYAQRELPGRGHVFIHSNVKGRKTWQQWWQNRDSGYARVANVDGRTSSKKMAGRMKVNWTQTRCSAGSVDISINAGMPRPASQ